MERWKNGEMENWKWKNGILLDKYIKMEKKYDIYKESKVYGFMVVESYQYITKVSKEYILSKQFLRSWTSIWANIMEAQEWQSKKDFLHKMSIALKEARESKYWIDLLECGWYLIWYQKYVVLVEKTKEMIWILTKIVKTTKLHLHNQ